MTAPSDTQLVDYYKDMLLARRFEERCAVLYTQQKFSGFCHLYIGQEAIATGSLNAIRKGQDYVITGYRDHTMPITLGMNPNLVMAELLGKATGCVRGKGGSMHMLSSELRFLGGHGIVGGQVPLATGVGWKIKYQKEDLVCLCFMGDAAINQGQFHEAMNMAAIWKLPVIFIIENNQYGMGTAISRSCPLETLADRAKAYAMRQEVIDGLDVIEVYSRMHDLVEDTRTTPQPTLVEMRTYRFRGHSMSDPQTYRTREEVDTYKERDPIQRLQKHLVDQKIASDSDFDTWEEEVAEKVEAAVVFAEESPDPALEELFEHVLV